MSLFKKQLSVLTFGIVCLSSLVCSAADTQLSFFGGALVAKMTWLTPPSSTKTTQLKIEVLDAQKQPLDLDPSLVGVGLFMDEMPEMGVEQQNVVSMSDASGSPVAGVFMVSDLQFSMSGQWSVRVTLPDPKNLAKTETQQFSLRVK